MASRTAYSTWTPQKPTLFDGHYLRNRSTLDIGVFGYIGIFRHKKHSPEVFSIPPGTPCIYVRDVYMCIYYYKCSRGPLVGDPWFRLFFHHVWCIKNKTLRQTYSRPVSAIKTHELLQV